MNWWARSDASGGETVDRAAHDAVRLAHRALDRFPGVVARHRYVAGGAAISSALVAMAGVAIALRMRAGQSAEAAIASVTEDELEGRTRYRIEDEVAETLALVDADADGDSTDGTAAGGSAVSDTTEGPHGEPDVEPAAESPRG
jgi:hypothetical protein